MSVYDYLIDHQIVNWPQVLADWLWLVPQRLTVWLMNRFGDLFIVLDDGSVYMLDVGGGTFEKVADSRDDFRAKIDEGNNANNWLMIPLVDKVVAAGITLGEGQCYSYLKPPVFGGDYVVENTIVLPIVEHFGVNASIHQQIRELPDGTEVTLVGKNDAGRGCDGKRS